MKVVGAEIEGRMAQVDENRYMRLESPQIGFTWYMWDEKGWLDVKEFGALEDAFQKEMNK